MDAVPEWSRPLRGFRGSQHRLAGIDVFYDFNWYSMFGHRRRAFPGGQSLSELVCRECADDKRPTLLLTDDDSVHAHIEENEQRYIAVVPIRDYLRDSGADTAAAYYAHIAATPVTRLASLSPDQVEQLLEENMTREALLAWASARPERMSLLRDVAKATDADAGTLTPDEVTNALQSLAVMDERVVDAVLEYINRFDGDTGVHRLLRQLTESQDGRTTATGVLAERLPERIADTRRQLEEYQELIASDDATETDVQRMLESSPWIVGLPYVDARPRVEIPRGEIDFVLDRFDGFFDIVELKGPGDVLISEPAVSPGARPASASAYSLGPALAKALAQAHHYRSILDDTRDLSEQYGLSDTRQPRVLILIGRSADLSSTGKEILRQLNLTLHRVEVIPYDFLGQRTAGVLDNIESLTLGEGSS